MSIGRYTVYRPIYCLIGGMADMQKSCRYRICRLSVGYRQQISGRYNYRSDTTFLIHSTILASRYTLLRVRFPDGLVLQGTFSVHERYRAAHDFVADNLELPLPFVLYAAGAGSQVREKQCNLEIVSTN